MYYNIISLSLGLLAWVLGGIAILRRRFAALSFGSLACCAVSLTVQLLEVEHRVELRDLSAIDDTIAAVAFAAKVLVVVTLVLNALALAAAMLRRKAEK